jgi:hypothetical protein
LDGLALGKFAKDESDAARQQQGCRGGQLLLDLPEQRSRTNTGLLLTDQ